MKFCLIVVGDRTTLATACKTADDIGFICTMSEEGKYIYRACEAVTPDLVVIDTQSEPLVATAFLQMVAELSTTRRVIVFCPTSLDRDLIARELHMGGEGMKMKPLDVFSMLYEGRHIEADAAQKH